MPDANVFRELKAAVLSFSISNIPFQLAFGTLGIKSKWWLFLCLLLIFLQAIEEKTVAR